MKHLYLDTNIIISFIKKGDIFNQVAEQIINYTDFRKISSVITILELASVISRQFNDFKMDVEKVKDWQNLNLYEKKAVILYYLLNKVPVQYYACKGYNNLTIFPGDFELEISIDFYKAIYIAPLSNLRTLDNLQIASAVNIRDILGIKIDYFITTDSLILENAKSIREYTHLTIIHPQKLVELENI